MVYVDSVRKTTAKMRRREQWDRRRGERRSSGTGGSKGQSAGTRQVVPGRSRAQMGTNDFPGVVRECKFYSFGNGRTKI